MKRLILGAVGLLGLGLGQPAQAETIISVTQISYDANLRPQCTAVRMNPATYGSLPADACTLGTAGADGPDRITKNTYDDAGQLKQVDQAYGTPIQRAYARYWYNPNGTKSNEADAKGNTSYLVYDGFDRLVTFYYPHPSSTGLSNGADYEAYGYDANGNKTSWRRRDGQWIFYTYDNLNREIVKDMPGGTSDDLYTGYDGLGHIVYKRFVSSSGSGVSYAYDGLGRVSSTTDLNGRTVGYQYNVTSTRSALIYPDGAGQGYSYNNTGALTWTGISGVGFQPWYDSLGRVIATGRDNTANSFYSYDAVSRLSSMTQDFAGTAYDITWSFSGRNPANQITKWGATSTAYDYKQLAAATTNNTYDGLNRDAGIAALSGGYDARGNMTFDGVRTMTYDLENRLKTVSAPGISLQLDYDPEGRLSKLTSSGAVTSFLYDGVNLIGEYDGAGNMTKRYMHTLGTDQPWVEFSGSAVGTGNATYLYANYQGSIIATADGTGNLTNLYKYGPYGEPKDANNVDSWSGERFRYTGQIMIPEAKLYYYKARVYDPIAGRFLQTDPIGSKDDLDLYAYVGGDPVNRSDPTGTVGFGPGPICVPCLLRAAGNGLSAANNWLNVKIATNVPVSITSTQAVGFATMASGQAKGTTDYTRGDAIIYATAPIDGALLLKGAPVVADGASLLSKAMGARDELATGLAPLRGKAPATVTAGYDVNTEQVAAAACGGGKCAEANVVTALGGDKSTVQFTPAIRPRTGAEVPVCPTCESEYGRGAFPPGTKFKTDN